MPTDRNGYRGFAQPLLLIVALVVAGIGVAVFVGSKNLVGTVLGVKTRSENNYRYKTDGIKVTVISPDASWDLTEYLCDSVEQCQKSTTSGKWWATISGGPTTEDGHDVFIEIADGWKDAKFLKVAVKETGLGNIYMNSGMDEQYHLYDLSAQSVGNMPSQVVFRRSSSAVDTNQ
jgi:hypothetical protein